MSKIDISDEAVEAGLKVWFGGYFNPGDVKPDVYGKDFRAALEAALPLILGKPQAYLIPHILSFKNVKRTSCPEHLQPDLEGTVAWGAEMWADDLDVLKDKHGVEHSPIPLYALKPSKEKGDV